jgi:hypothetical protein
VLRLLGRLRLSSEGDRVWRKVTDYLVAGQARCLISLEDAGYDEARKFTEHKRPQS